MKVRHIILVLLLLNLIQVAGFAQTIHGHCAIKNFQTGLLLRLQEAVDGTPIVAYSSKFY